MNALATLVTGRRSRWVVIALWVLLAVAAMPLAMKLPDVTKDSLADFIPAESQSRQIGEILEERFPGGNRSVVVLVYQREGGLLPEDQAVIMAQAQEAFAVDRASPGLVPFGPQASPDLLSAQGDTALVVFQLDQLEQRESRGIVEELREIAGQTPEGLDAYVTGMAPLEIDNTITREESDFTLFAVTVVLVLTLLIAVYRSPVIALAPLITVGLAYLVVTGILYLCARAGMSVTGPSQQLLLVLMFGATTDYCLLLVSRYVEDVRHTEHEADAMRVAVRRVAPSVIASAATTILALLTLVLASVGLVSGLGPVNAIGLAVGMIAALTLLPAIITVLGRRGFWPSQARVAYATTDQAAPSSRGAWRRIGAAVMGRPVMALGGVVLLFAVGALGLTQLTTSGNVRADIKRDTDGTRGFDVVAERFPAGVLGPAMVLIERPGSVVGEADIAAAAERLASVPNIGLITPPTAAAEDGSAVVFNVVFPDDPFGNPAIERVSEMREALDGLDDGLRGLVGGAAGEAADYRDGLDRDFRLVIPLVLGVVFIVMVALLRSIVAPLYILISTFASFFSILGISVLLGKSLMGATDFNSVYPVFAFVFLVALGVDYNIFLMDRVREEAVYHGTREGTLRALVVTGPVITSAGLILAGTFAALLTVPTWPLQMLGLTVALGVLLDTFVVRALFIPAMTALLGDKNWWPSKLAKREAGEVVTPKPTRRHGTLMIKRNFGRVELGSGTGSVAVIGDIALFVPDGDAAGDLVDVAREAVAVDTPAGRGFARRVAALLSGDDADSVPDFGAVAGDDSGLVVLLRGNVGASFAAADGGQEQLSGTASVTLLDRILPPGTGEVLLAPLGTTSTGSSTASLEAGIVPGGWLRVLSGLGGRPAGQEPPMPAPAAASPPAPAPSQAQDATEQVPAAPPAPATATLPPRSAAAATLLPGSVSRTLGRLVFDDGSTIELDGDYVVGREPATDPRVSDGSARPLVLEDPDGTVSRVHVEIRSGDGELRLVDRGSTNGTHLWDSDAGSWDPITPGEPRAVPPGARGSIGKRTFVYEPGAEPDEPEHTGRAAATIAVRRVTGVLTAADGTAHRLDQAHVIGRDPAFDAGVERGQATPIAIPDDPHISRVHAHLSVIAGTVYVRDADSAAGTFVATTGSDSWTRVGSEPVELTPGSSLRVGTHVYTFDVDDG